MSEEIILDDMDYNRITFDNGGVQCECTGYMPGLGGEPCNRPAHPLSGYCAGCSPTGCWCTCADCDPSSSETSEPHDDGLSDIGSATPDNDTTVSESEVTGEGGPGDGEAGGGPVTSARDIGLQPPICMSCRPPAGSPPLYMPPLCTACGPPAGFAPLHRPDDIEQPLCACIQGHGDDLFRCTRRSLRESSYCAECTINTCECMCDHCDPVDVMRVAEPEAEMIDDYDHEGRVYFNPNNRQGIDPPRCACSLGDGRCEFEATREGFCDRCFARRCMCPCRGCDPDDFA